MEVYINDMLVKTKEENSLLSDLEVVFNCLQWHNMRLNLQKFVFAIEAGKFFGFMLTHREIEANPDKCWAILEMKSLMFVKEVQCPTGRITSLSRFMVASARKAFPFFSLLKKESTFKWMPTWEAVFIEFKRYLSYPLILSKLETDKPLFLYLSVSDVAIASTLVLEDAW